MTGSIDDVDLHIVVEDGRVLGQNRDAALALQLVGVHHPFYVMFVGAKSAALLQHGIDQSSFAMIDVRNNGDVANP